ncbi:hypothetical protein RHOFW104T7_04675 [Rhodanobacter thiooxydans]|uniref:Uncharacterized protein n=1 Tax=Rhodanobacter thiooxydans TaxID=416169 RepID=A0A154QLW5_9GAMM|nr:hypothetical protein [Rhodanobacter thiooxydans]EIM00174.1 hypothetical protein UUA_06958 [Rhodanobacter thiooxydans LCS2]KZC25235.1 hypothetical protein RHOFW104T7_04675 [Rhodanobacter thiooxydans]MCW0203018.1 hypothetical protein [Rhodanobacter thiooxydans]
MASRLNRDKALSEKSSDIGKLVPAGRSREEAASRKPSSRPKLEQVTYSFNLDDIQALQIFRVATGVVINPPRPRQGWGIKLTLELPVERPQR